jgi:hypothetical protein
VAPSSAKATAAAVGAFFFLLIAVAIVCALIGGSPEIESQADDEKHPPAERSGRSSWTLPPSLAARDYRCQDRRDFSRLSPVKGGAMTKQARRDSGRSRDKPVSVAEVKRALKASDDNIPPGYETRLNFEEERRALQRSLAAELEPLVTQDLALAKAKRALTRYENQKARLLKRRTAEIGTELSASMGDSQAVARRRPGLLGQPDLFGSATVLTLAPSLIWAKEPSSMLVDSRIEPAGYSWAKAKLLRDNVKDTSMVAFYYLWTNMGTGPALVNARCHAIFNGMLSAVADNGIVFGGQSSASCDVWLVPLEWWKQPALADFSQTSQQWQNVAIAQAWGSGILSLATGDLDVEPVSDVHRDVRFEQFSVPAGASAVFEIQARFNYTCEDGSAGFDFASQPTYSIASLFQLEIPIQPK